MTASLRDLCSDSGGSGRHLFCRSGASDQQHLSTVVPEGLANAFTPALASLTLSQAFSFQGGFLSQAILSTPEPRTSAPTCSRECSFLFPLCCFQQLSPFNVFLRPPKHIPRLLKAPEPAPHLQHKAASTFLSGTA
ncbi:hypothetical protein AMECASPLE_031756 [Ameca splendens]|uniref:Uncharacterized protein n=1 Tax=Ameca splendens TaxID=208324 RepID=A0ABV0ZH05_9TELE